MQKYFSVRPNLYKLNQIKEWLEEEYNALGTGFWVNWPIIKNRFSQKKLCCVISKGIVLGFCTYHIIDSIAYIEVMEVHPKYRQKGIGRYLVKSLIHYLRKLNVLIVELESNPIDSLSFWYSLDFKDLPKETKMNEYEKKQNLLYKVLVPSLEVANPNKQIKVALWNVDFHSQASTTIEASWVWGSDKEELDIPIIYPANRNWKLMITNDDVILFCGQIRELNYHFPTYTTSNYLIIKELNKIYKHTK